MTSRGDEAEQDGKSMAAEAKEILEKGEEQLAALDKAQIFKFQQCRDFPQFEATEITKGPLLGKGGLSVVHEVLKITLQLPTDCSTIDETTTPAVTTNKEANHDHDTSILVSPSEELKEDEHHYDIAIAREFMSKHGIRDGRSRYAIKQLKKDELDPVQRARGAVDLAIEIKFLSAICHPNIVKMRGYSNTPRWSEDTFLVIDRLYEGLDQKIEEWERTLAAHKGCCGLISKDNPAIQKLLEERMLVAYDLSSAFDYLHSLRLVYRDIKPENIGFDVRGDVKLFDFGLSKSLDPELKAEKGYGYKLTRRVGRVPYMAPEVALGLPYGQGADVFSFGILLWEIISLDRAFNGYSAEEYFIRVVENNERLPFKGRWPIIIKSIVNECWDANPEQRPPMKRVGTLIRGELEDMAADARAINRTKHMMNRSRRSTHVIMESSRHSNKGNLTRCRRSSSREIFVGGDTCGMKKQLSLNDDYNY